MGQIYILSNYTYNLNRYIYKQSEVEGYYWASLHDSYTNLNPLAHVHQPQCHCMQSSEQSY